jgi:hypothetical protein
MRGLLSRVGAWQQRKASRYAPNPSMIIVAVALNLLMFVLSGAAAAVNASAPDGTGTVGWILVGLCGVALVLALLAGVWNWRRTVDRAVAVYGVEWRSLTKADRAGRWFAHQQATAITYRDWQPPSDPSNPYSRTA